MRVFAIAVAAMVLAAGSPSKAAELQVSRSVVTRSVEGRAIYQPDCSIRDLRDPYKRDVYGYGPRNDEPFFGALGYRCYAGAFVYFPNPPRCRTVLVQGPEGWWRERRCYD